MRFLKTLLWQRPWIPLALTLIAAALIGRHAEGAEFTFTGEKWAKPYRYAISDSCPSYVGHLYGIALDDMSPVPHERLPDTDWAGFTVDQHSIVFCSDEAPDGSSLRSGGLIVNTESITNTEGAVIGKAQWAYNEQTREIVQCDVWLKTSALDGDGEFILTLIKHEAGHCLGLRHVAEFEAVMYSSVFWAKDWHVIDQAQMSLIYDGCHTIVHESGTQFVPSANVDRLVRGTEWAEWEGAPVSYLIDAGAVWPDGVYGLGSAQC